MPVRADELNTTGALKRDDPNSLARRESGRKDVAHTLIFSHVPAFVRTYAPFSQPMINML